MVDCNMNMKTETAGARLEKILDKYHEEMIENLQKLIRIKSVTQAENPDNAEAPFGEGAKEALDFVMSLGKEKGFECINYDNYACELSFGEGGESVGAALHLDVVPASEKGWSFPPFAGQINDGKIYGRGVLDDKGPMIAVFYACLAIKESGLPINKRIKQIMGCNEESGTFPCIAYYLSHAEDVPSVGIVPDSWFPCVFSEKDFISYKLEKEIIAEDGEIPHISSISGGEAYNMVPAFAQAVFTHEGADREMTRLGKTAHASTPQDGENAIFALLRALEKEKFGPAELKKTLAEILPYLDTDGKGMGIDYIDETGELTNNLGMISYDGKKLVLYYNARIPVTFGLDNVERELQKIARKLEMSYERVVYNKHFYMPHEDKTMQKLIDIYRRETGDMQSQPKAMGVGSYARMMSGFIPFGPAFQGEEFMIHKEDEFIGVDRLLQISKIYAKALYELAK